MSTVPKTSKESSEKTDFSSVPRYDVSIFDTPFSQLPDPKRVWLGAPNSRLEGLGKEQVYGTSEDTADNL